MKVGEGKEGEEEGPACMHADKTPLKAPCQLRQLYMRKQIYSYSASAY